MADTAVPLAPAPAGRSIRMILLGSCWYAGIASLAVAVGALVLAATEATFAAVDRFLA